MTRFSEILVREEISDGAKFIIMKGIILKDVIQIIDQDILDAMTYTLYSMKYQEVIDVEEKRYSEFIEQMITTLTTKKEYKFLAFDSQEMQQNYEIQLLCDLFNNWKVKYYVTDMFLVTEVYEDYFKISLLNSYQESEFRRVGKLEKMLTFLSGLKFPYKDRNKTFFKMGCAFK